MEKTLLLKLEETRRKIDKMGVSINELQGVKQAPFVS